MRTQEKWKLYRFDQAFFTHFHECIQHQSIMHRSGRGTYKKK